METSALIQYILMPIVVAVLGYILRSISMLRDKVSNLIDRTEAMELIDLKQEGLEAKIDEVTRNGNRVEDTLRRLEEKLDKLSNK